MLTGTPLLKELVPLGVNLMPCQQNGFLIVLGVPFRISDDHPSTLYGSAPLPLCRCKQAILTAHITA